MNSPLNVRQVENGPEGRPLARGETAHGDPLFESLLVDISARFVNIDEDSDLDKEIQDAMSAICTYLKIEVSALWQDDVAHPGVYVMTHHHIPAENFPPVPNPLEASSSFPWVLSEVLAKRRIVLSSIDDAPPEARVDRQGWDYFGLKNVLCYPLYAGRHAPIGGVAFHDRSTLRQWTPELVNRLDLVSGIFAAALQRKRNWKALHDSENRLMMALEASSAGSWIYDKHSERFRLGKLMSRLIGVSPESEIGVDAFFGLVHPEDRPGVLLAFQQARELNRPSTVEYRLLRPGETAYRWMQTQGSFSGNRDGGAFMGITMDISERKKSELDAQELRRELAHVTRASMMGELAASISHELNQPLAAILSNAQAARRFLTEAEPDMREIRDIIEDIILADKRAAGVIQRLRSLFLKNNREPPENLDLNAVVVEVLELLHSELIAREVSVELRLADPPPQVRFTRVDLQQILLNLILNAMEAMERAPRRMWISTEESEGGIQLSLRDAGPGIAENLLEEIFRPYFSTKATGMGMGLSVAHSMVESHGGRIWAETHPEGGAVFTIDFPETPQNTKESIP